MHFLSSGGVGVSGAAHRKHMMRHSACRGPHLAGDLPSSWLHCGGCSPANPFPASPSLTAAPSRLCSNWSPVTVLRILVQKYSMVLQVSTALIPNGFKIALKAFHHFLPLWTFQPSLSLQPLIHGIHNPRGPEHTLMPSTFPSTCPPLLYQPAQRWAMFCHIGVEAKEKVHTSIHACQICSQMWNQRQKFIKVLQAGLVTLQEAALSRLSAGHCASP